MEAEEQVNQPSPEPSPPPQETRDESEEESEEEEEEEEEERESSDEERPEDSSDDQDGGSEDEDAPSSMEDSPGRDSPPSPPDRGARLKHSSKKLFSQDSKPKTSSKVPEHVKERTVERPHEESPNRLTESSHRHTKGSFGGESPVKKKKLEDKSFMDSVSSSPVKTRMAPANDGGFLDALFPSPAKVGNKASSSANRTPNRVKEGSSKISSPVKLKDKKPSQSLSKHASSESGTG